MTCRILFPAVMAPLPAATVFQTSSHAVRNQGLSNRRNPHEALYLS